jgi:hypothetical protein
LAASSSAGEFDGPLELSRLDQLRARDSKGWMYSEAQRGVERLGESPDYDRKSLRLSMAFHNAGEVARDQARALPNKSSCLAETLSRISGSGVN